MSNLAIRLKNLGVSSWRLIKLKFKTVIHSKIICHYKPAITRKNVTINFEEVVSVKRFSVYPIKERFSWKQLAN